MSLLLAGLLALAAAQEPEPRPRFDDQTGVSRVLLDVRIVDDQGRPLPGVTPGDLLLTVDDKPVAVESATWIAGAAGAAVAPSTQDDEAAPPAPLPPAPGRLVVYLFQKDLHPTRSAGLLRMVQEASRIAGGLGADDKVAVMSFDTHLRLWQDFTRDAAQLRKAMERSVLFGEAPPAAAPSTPSLHPSFDAEKARNAGSLEAGLQVVAAALAPLAGSKSVVLFGWGMGQGGASSLWLDGDYGRAIRDLTKSRATLFVLDVTDADEHTLATTLKQAAFDTGGFYAKTHDFPKQALARLEGALAGHYLLSFEAPAGPTGFHAVKLTLKGRPGRVLARPGYRD